MTLTPNDIAVIRFHGWEPPVDVRSDCVAVFHNVCGRRTTRKVCDCKTCRNVHLTTKEPK